MDKQLFIAAAVPTLTVVAGFIQSNFRMAAIEGRLSRIEAELVQIREKVWSFNRDLRQAR